MTSVKTSFNLTLFLRVQFSYWSVHFLKTILKPPMAKSRQVKLSPKGPPFLFLLFQGNLQNRTCLKCPPLDFFRHSATFFEIFLIFEFLIFCNRMYFIKSRRAPFYFFRHYATFLNCFFKNFKFFYEVKRDYYSDFFSIHTNWPK